MNTTSIEARLSQLEQRVSQLEGVSVPPTATSEGGAWLVEALHDGPAIPNGSIIFAGDVQIDGRTYQYQWQRPTDAIVKAEWDDNIERLAALAHPLRANILRCLLRAPATAADLVDSEVITSTGAAYHHLGALQAAGWLSKSGGTWSIRPSRVIPLMTIIIATEDH